MSLTLAALNTRARPKSKFPSVTRRITECVSLPVAIFTFVINCPVASAQTVVIPHTDRGWYDNTGFHNPGNPNYVVGDNSFTVSRNFFVFNLASVVQPIASAKLVLFVPSSLAGPGYSSPDPSENYELRDISTSIATLVGGTGRDRLHRFR